MLDLCSFCHNVQYRKEIIYVQHLKALPFLFSHFDSTQDVCRGILIYRNYGGTQVKKCCVAYDDPCPFHDY